MECGFGPAGRQFLVEFEALKAEIDALQSEVGVGNVSNLASKPVSVRQQKRTYLET